MRVPKGPIPQLPALPTAACCLGLLLTGTGWSAEAGSSLRQAAAPGLPRYDPAIREAYLAAQAAADAAPHPEPPSPAPAPVAPPAPAPARETLVLDPIIVRPDRTELKPLPTLPRLSFFAPVRDLPAEPFESPRAREARLVRKHLGPLGQALNRIRLPFIGPIFSANVEQAETLLQRAQELNAMADAIDIGTLAGQDPEIIRKLRAEYLRLYYLGPK